jgi:hypothetical protein
MAGRGKFGAIQSRMSAVLRGYVEAKRERA